MKRTYQPSKVRRARTHGFLVRMKTRGGGVMTYVAETQEKAEQEFSGHMRYFFEDALRTLPQFLAPPGYLSVDQLKAQAADAAAYAARSHSSTNESSASV